MNEPRAHFGQKRNAEEHRHQLCSDAIWIRLSKFSTQSPKALLLVQTFDSCQCRVVLLAHLSSEARSSSLAPSDIASALVNMKAASIRSAEFQVTHVNPGASAESLERVNLDFASLARDSKLIEFYLAMHRGK